METRLKSKHPWKTIHKPMKTTCRNPFQASKNKRVCCSICLAFTTVRAYLETLLNYGPAAKKSQLTASLYYKDKAGKIDTTDPTLADNNANVNPGLKARYAFNKESGTVEMAGPLFCDLFMTDRLLLSFVDCFQWVNHDQHRREFS